MINHGVEILYLQHLEYKMEPVNLPDDFHLSKMDIVVTLLPLRVNGCSNTLDFHGSIYFDIVGYRGLASILKL